MVLVTYLHDEGSLCKARWRYIVDPIFQKVSDSPQACENFIVSGDRMIQLRFGNRIVTCMPSTCIDDRWLQEIIIDQTNLWEAIGVDFVELLPSSKDWDGEYDWAIAVITEDFGNSSYCVNSPDSLKWDVHNIFYVSLLHIHVPNDDHLSPGRRIEQTPEFGGINREWMINHILTHRGNYTDLEFQVERSADDQTWISHLGIQRSATLGDRRLGGETTAQRQGVPITSANIYLCCPCPTCHSFSFLKLSPRLKSFHRFPPSSSIHPNAPNTPHIHCAGPTLWFIIHVLCQDDSIHRRLHTLQSLGYAESRLAYELGHLDSTARPANSNDPALNSTTASLDAKEYLGTRCPVPVEGEDQFTEEQRMVLNHRLWDSEARSARCYSIAARAYEAQKVKRATHNIARGPITDRTHQMLILLGHEHLSMDAISGANTSIISFPTSTPSTLAKLEILIPPATPALVVSPNHAPLPITTSPPPLLRPSVLDGSILTDEDLKVLHGQMDTGATERMLKGNLKWKKTVRDL